jgi:hypothetical protein
VFVVVQQGQVGLYLGVSFAPNHKGMPILNVGDKTDFLRRQVLTSRNIRGGRFIDLAFGGLNTRSPRPNLRRAQPIVAQFCRQRGLVCCQTSLVGSDAQTVCHLNTVGRAPQPRPRRHRNCAVYERPSTKEQQGGRLTGRESPPNAESTVETAANVHLGAMVA